MAEHKILNIVGLNEREHDAVQKISTKVFIPDGKLVTKPITQGASSADYTKHFINQCYAYIQATAESDRTSIIAVIVDDGSGRVPRILADFYPFALCHVISSAHIELASSGNDLKRRLNDLLDRLGQAARHVQRVAKLVSFHTSNPARTPLLLPVRNFSSRALSELLDSIFEGACVSNDPEKLIGRAINDFIANHPFALHETSKKCFSDGKLAFNGPGRARHGFYRHSAGGHTPQCLLNARSRLGGSYDYTFHYDGQPVIQLAATYPNCHDDPTAPNKEHVNIAPNDCII